MILKIISRNVEADASELCKRLAPEKQFDIITSFGGTDADKFIDDIKFLKQDGLLILGSSPEMPFFDPKKQGNLYDFFNPVILVSINGIKQTANWEDQDSPITFDDISMKYLVLRLNNIK